VIELRGTWLQISPDVTESIEMQKTDRCSDAKDQLRRKGDEVGGFREVNSWALLIRTSHVSHFFSLLRCSLESALSHVSCAKQPYSMHDAANSFCS
jgi:hypothetical protein